MAMEMDEEQAYRTFRKMMELLCIAGAGKPKRAETTIEPDIITIPEPTPVAVEAREASAQPEPETDEAVSAIQGETGLLSEATEKMISIGYGGFLYIKCPDCGKVKGFCAKTRLSNFRCDCGSVTRLENMVPLYMRCECGRNARYLTNMEEPVFDIVCYDCGNPVPVAWNSKKKQYETIRG